MLAGAATGCWSPGWTPGCASPAADAVDAAAGRGGGVPRAAGGGRRDGVAAGGAGRRAGADRRRARASGGLAARARKATSLRLAAARWLSGNRAGRGAAGAGPPRRRRARARRRPAARAADRRPGPRCSPTPGRTAVVTPWRTVVLPDARGSRRRGTLAAAGLRRRAGSRRRGHRLRRPAGLREGPRRRPGRRLRRARPGSRRPAAVHWVRLRTALRRAAGPRTSTPSRSPGGGYLVDGVATRRDWRRDAYELRPRRRRDLPPVVRHHPRRGRPRPACPPTSPRSPSG